MPIKSQLKTQVMAASYELYAILLIYWAQNDVRLIHGDIRYMSSGDSRTPKGRGSRWGQGILRRGRVTKAYERKNCKFKGALQPG